MVYCIMSHCSHACTHAAISANPRMITSNSSLESNYITLVREKQSTALSPAIWFILRSGPVIPSGLCAAQHKLFPLIFPVAYRVPHSVESNKDTASEE